MENPTEKWTRVFAASTWDPTCGLFPSLMEPREKSLNSLFRWGGGIVKSLFQMPRPHSAMGDRTRLRVHVNRGREDERTDAWRLDDAC